MSNHVADKLQNIRREYGQHVLDEKNAVSSPIIQFEHWFLEALKTEIDDPSAMVLSTVDAFGHPDSRVVLLKGIESNTFVFYTNYGSVKSQQMSENKCVALNFFWSKSARQVRVRGTVSRVSEATSDAYFAVRPRMSQLSAHASRQSHIIATREELEKRLYDLSIQYGDDKFIPRPFNWGGFAVYPTEIEFWQGRDNRMHDRLQYRRSKNEQGEMLRLEP